MQKSTGYNKCSRAESQMDRWKAMIGPKLKARHFDNQKTETKTGVRVLSEWQNLAGPSSSALHENAVERLQIG
ncbi:hypothetical protein JOH51_007065 [Rhizobium leguminosarum]|nr:hypothetical protein [Rhizobium leguminosarum]